MKKIISVLLAVAILFSFAGCSTGKSTAKNLVGTWLDVNEGDDYKIVFNEDNTGVISSGSFFNLPITWEAKKDSVSIIASSISEEMLTYNVIKDGEIIKIVSEDEKTVLVSEENYAAEQAKMLEEKKANSVAIEVNKTYEDPDYADIKIKKITSTDKIMASLDNSMSYTAEEGSVYIDVVMDYTNNTKEAINSENILEFTAIKNDGTVYKADNFYIETSGGTNISSYVDVAPLTTVRLHCACEVPKGEDDYSLILDLNGKTYGYNYALNEVVNDVKKIKIKDVIEDEDVAKVEFKSVKFTDDLRPSNTSDFYTHYPVDDSSNTYLVVRFDITSNYTSAKLCEEFINVTAKFMNKYTYSGFVVVEDTDGKGFSSYEDIKPLSTRKFYFLIEVPKKVADSDYELTIAFAGEEYSYKG